MAETVSSSPLAAALEDLASWVDLSSFTIPLPRPEDLLIMKAVSRRPRDVLDLESILEAHPKPNLRRARRWVREFSLALDMPEILQDLEAILSRRRKQKK